MSAQPGTIDADFQSVPGTSPAVITSDLAVESGYRKIRLTEWVFVQTGAVNHLGSFCLKAARGFAAAW
jgi:hypothetical protein